MANVTLESIAGGLVVLPKLKFIGSPPSWPVSSNKQIEEAKMADGSRRFAFFGVKREMPIVLGYLSKAELDAMILLNSYNEVLKYVNNNQDATEYEVVISAFSYEPERMDIRSMERYRVEMTLREA